MHRHTNTDTTAITFALAAPDDARALLAIYDRYLSTPVTFEYAAPSPEAFARRMAHVTAMYPWIVCREGSRILGYAYAHAFAERAAYQWNAELSVYLEERSQGQRLGHALYGALMALLRQQGVLRAWACITLPNAASEALHTGWGFRLSHVHPCAGFKNGAWHDVAWYRKELGAHAGEPEALRPVSALPPPLLRETLARWATHATERRQASDRR